MDLGIAPGDRVVVMLPNGPDVSVTYNALWRAGAAITPAMFLLPPDELRRIIIDSEATAVVTSPDFLANIKTAAEGADDLKWIICTGKEPVEGTVAFEELAAHEPGEIVDRDDSDMASLLYTGGTTGASKGVMLSHENHAVCSKGLYDISYVEGVTRVLTALPLAHAFGLTVTVSGFFAREPAQAFLMKWFDPMGWLQIVQNHKVQRSAAVPSMLQMLLNAPLEDFDLSSWLYFGVGAAPLAREVIDEFERRVPSCIVTEGYGCTESGGAATASPPKQRRISAVGKPFEGYEVKIMDPENDGVEMPTGEPGEVCIRSKGVMLGYWKSPDVTASTLRDGWLHTGDIGRFDDDGYLYIVDRIKDLIIRGGFNIYPRDVEDALLEHPAVEIAGVVGKPDPKYGEEVVAFVSLRSGQQVTAEELTEHCKTKIGRHKYPREVRIIGFVPLTPVGKVDRKALRQML